MNTKIIVIAIIFTISLFFVLPREKDHIGGAFYKSYNGIYYLGHCWNSDCVPRKYRISEADIETFKAFSPIDSKVNKYAKFYGSTLDGVAKDKNHVYKLLFSYPYEDIGYTVLDDAVDVESFNYITGKYFKDKNNIYYISTSMDAPGYIIMDKNLYYLEIKEVDNEYCIDSSDIHDKYYVAGKYLIYGHKIISEIPDSKVKSLSCDIVYSSSSLYIKGEHVLDLNNMDVIDLGGSYYLHNKNIYYYFYVDNSFSNVKEADYKSFEYQSDIGAYDKNHHFINGEIVQ